MNADERGSDSDLPFRLKLDERRNLLCFLVVVIV